jgi:hypothetical protein
MQHSSIKQGRRRRFLSIIRVASLYPTKKSLEGEKRQKEKFKRNA